MKKYRLNRLFAVDGRCLNVAVDHGFFGEYSFLSGIEDMRQVVPALFAAGPDAVQLTVGMAGLLQDIPGKPRPALVLRVDVANIYGSELPAHLFNHLIECAVEQALILDAACICTNLFNIAGQPMVHRQCIENISRLKPECERYGMPLMVEPLVFQPGGKAGGYAIDGDLQKIMTNVRQAVELGADVIKADPSTYLDDYHRVVEIASGCPVLVRGGSKASEGEIMQRTYGVIQQGAAGIVYGRNIIQHANPGKMVQALMSIVHYGATPGEALHHVLAPEGASFTQG